MNSITGPVVDWATHLIGNWGLWGVFFLMVLESACIPIPSEAIMLFAGFAVASGKMSFFAAVAVGVAGNVVGSWISYAVGLYGGRPFVDRYGKYVLLSHHKLDVAERWFTRYGPPAIFFSRMLPIVRTFISLPAGAARMNVPKFSAYTIAGCIPWVILLTLDRLQDRPELEAHRALPALRRLRRADRHPRTDRLADRALAAAAWLRRPCRARIRGRRRLTVDPMHAPATPHGRDARHGR